MSRSMLPPPPPPPPPPLVPLEGGGVVVDDGVLAAAALMVIVPVSFEEFESLVEVSERVNVELPSAVAVTFRST